MGYYDDAVLPRLIDVILGAPFEKVRSQVCAGLEGDVLEVGFGSGRNVPHYPAAVTRVRAVDPAVRGRQIAAKRLDASSVPVEFVGLDGQHLPVADESVDHVLVTWTLCTIPEPEVALAEMRRVLRPGGGVHFVEHGRSPKPRLAKWQERLNPFWGPISGGCHLDRPVVEMFADAGYRVESLEEFDAFGPSFVTHMFRGFAVP